MDSLTEILKDYETDSKGFRCKLCGICFPPQSNKVLVKHRVKHLDPKLAKPFPCNECENYSGRSAMALDRHMKKYHGRPDPKLFECTYCPKTFRTWNMCQMHINEHTGENPFKCHECGLGFPRVSKLKDHLKKMKHRDPRSGQVKDEARIIPCAKCGKKFDTQANLMTHMKAAGHDDGVSQ